MGGYREVRPLAELDDGGEVGGFIFRAGGRLLVVEIAENKVVSAWECDDAEALARLLRGELSHLGLLRRKLAGLLPGMGPSGYLVEVYRGWREVGSRRLAVEEGAWASARKLLDLVGADYEVYVTW